jgi:hypothetical protein
MDKHQLDGDRVFVVRGFLTPDECRSYVAESEHAGYEDATITTAGGAVMAKHIRDNARLIVDNSSLADEWWRRAGPLLPSASGGGVPLASTSGFVSTGTSRVRGLPRILTAISVERMANAVS